MLKGALFIYLTLFTAFCNGQQRLADSLQKQLSVHLQRDSVRLHLLNELAFQYSSMDPGKGLQTADSAIALARSLKLTDELATAYSRKAVNYQTMGEDSVAVIMFQQAYKIYERSGRKPNMAKVLHNIALTYFGVSEYVKAIENHERSYELFREVGEKRLMARALNGLGVNYMYLADYPRALGYYFQALKLFEESRSDSTGIAQVLNNIGITYKDLGDYSHSQSYYEKALSVYRGMDNEIGMASVFGNLGTVYDAKGKPEESLGYYQKALAINKKVGYKRGMASDLSNLGIIYTGLDHYAEALKYLNEALQLYRELGDKNSMSIVLNQIGIVYNSCSGSFLKQQDLDTSKRYAIALAYQQQALKMAREAEAPDRQYEALEQMSGLYARQKNYRKALETFTEFTHLRDSVHSLQNAKEITRKAMQYEFDKKFALTKAENEKKAALSQFELNKQRMVRNMAMTGAVFLLLAGAAGAVLYKKRRDAEAQKKEAIFKALVSDTEMKALRAQMNPHFIFNSLNAISDYMMKNNARLADEYLGKFARLMRRVLENSEQHEIPLADDLESLELYIQLEAMRLNHSFTYEFRIDHEIDLENTLVPPLLMQPFVENSIRHGLGRKKGMGKIIIWVRRENGTLVCGIEDNGIGRERAAQIAGEQNMRDKKSLGIKITESRINILNQTKKEPAVMLLRDLPEGEGTSVEIKLPLALNF